MKLYLIVNPNAGKKKGAAAAEEAVRIFTDKGIETESITSDFPGHTMELAKKVDTDLYDGIVAVGGDGTLFEVINGLARNPKTVSIPIGVIPVGTGNSFIKDLEIMSMEDAVERIAAGDSRRIDTGDFSHGTEKHLFINLLGAGFVSNVAYRAKKFKALGALSYIIGVLQEMIFLKSTPIELIIDGETIKRDSIFVEICNSRFTGGDMLMSPESKIDDGLLEVVVLNKISRIKLLRLFPALFKGLHVKDPSVEVFKGKNILLKSENTMHLTPDGEILGKTPVNVSINPGSIEMFA